MVCGDEDKDIVEFLSCEEAINKLTIEYFFYWFNDQASLKGAIRVYY